jgi:hypothetical protein
MQQLGESFLQTFLVPYIKNNILGNVNNDERLQRIIRYDATPTQLDIAGLEATYFANTGTVLDTDLELRKVFFKEFIDFVNRQKTIAAGNVYLLAHRLLPDTQTKEYSQAAKNNIEKFGFESIKAMEEHIADNLIKQKQLNGEISDEKAQDDRAKLKEGKLILVKNKDEDFDYKDDDDIRRANSSSQKAAEFWNDVLFADSPSGNVAVGMNPLDIPAEGEDEKGATLTGLQKQVWSGVSVKMEKELENNGIYVEARLKVDANGVAYGTVQDKRGVRLKVESSVIKPGKRNYKFTFVNQPAKKFLVDQDELKSEFKDKKRSAAEVYTNKQLQERKREALINKAAVPVTEGPKAPPKTGGVGVKTKEETESRVPGGGEEFEGPVPAAPVQLGKRADIEEETEGREAVYPAGPMEAKENYDQQRLAETTDIYGGSAGRGFRAGKKKGGGLQSGTRVFGNSGVGKVLKYYAATAAGFTGAVGIYSFLT